MSQQPTPQTPPLEFEPGQVMRRDSELHKRERAKEKALAHYPALAREAQQQQQPQGNHHAS